MSPTPAHILVVGSLNVDLVMRAPRLPHPGETIIGATFHMAVGGKGANQAVAAARAGASVAMIGRLGNDAFGALARDALRAAGVNTDAVLTDSDAATGTGQIVVDDAGRNAIVVASGANACVSVADVVRQTAAWDGARLVVLQLEIPLVTVAATIAAAAARELPVVLNAAPAQPLPADLWHAVDWLVANEVEAAQLLGRPVTSVHDAVEAARALRRTRHRVVITLGAAGAVLLGDAQPLHVAAPRVDVVDTTAAGDAFVGALAAALVSAADDADAVRRAVLAGSLACTKLGAIPSLPTAADVAALQNV